MTSRERWTVYPLLCFALALGFKSNYRDPLQFSCNAIECRSLTVRDNLTVKRINGSNYISQTGSGGHSQVVIDGAKLLIKAGKSHDDGLEHEVGEQTDRSTSEAMKNSPADSQTSGEPSAAESSANDEPSQTQSKASEEAVATESVSADDPD